jgi:hypothetical protein
MIPVSQLNGPVMIRIISAICDFSTKAAFTVWFILKTLYTLRA